MMTPYDFIQMMAPGAIASARIYGVPAGFNIAEAGLESGWYKSLLSQEANNFWGVKADKSWTGPTIDLPTHEHINGKDIIEAATWRKYDTPRAAMDDHALFFLNNERYKAALQCKDSVEFAVAIAKAGYATDPDYAEKLAEIINGHKLAQYDEVQS